MWRLRRSCSPLRLITQSNGLSKMAPWWMTTQSGHRDATFLLENQRSRKQG
jgi:hypothetical protein